MLDLIVVGAGSRSLMHVSALRALGCQTLSVVSKDEVVGDEPTVALSFPVSADAREHEALAASEQPRLTKAVASLGLARQYLVVIATADPVSCGVGLVLLESVTLAAKSRGEELDWGQVGVVALLPTAALPQTPEQAKLSAFVTGKLLELSQRRLFDPLVVSDEDNFLSILSSLIPPQEESQEQEQEPAREEPEPTPVRVSVFSKLYGE